jgi:hypothetical protein
MAKSKQPASAAQRREQMRQQRQQRIDTGKNKKRSRKRASRNNPWPLLITILVLVAVIIGIFFVIDRQQQANSSGGGEGAASTFKAITSLDPTLLANVGTGNASNLMHAVPANATVPNGPNGKPMVLYEGADYCPYCAAQRWPLIIALGRFGTFSQLEPLTSSEGNYITYTFHKSTYTSQYVDFVALETTDNQGNKLDTPTAEQAQLITTYNAPPYTSSAGSIPFLLFGNKQTSTGAFYSPQVLTGLSYTDVANQLKDPNSDVAKGMLGAANDMTAAICQLTNNQPANVCTSGSIPSIQQSLPKASSGSGGGALAALDMPYVATETRRSIA